MLPSSVDILKQLEFHSNPLPRGHRFLPHPTTRALSPFRPSLPPPDPQLLPFYLQQAKKRPAGQPFGGLIATVPNLKTDLTPANTRVNNFLIATKTAIHPLPDFPSEWPRHSERVRIGTRLLLLKLLSGDLSGLRGRACSLFYLAGPK